MRRQRDRGCIEQIRRLGESAPLSAIEAADHPCKQFAEQSAVAVAIGIRQSRTNRRRDAEVIQAIRVARHASLDVAQRLRPGQLGKQHGHQMALAVEPSRVGIGFQLRDQSLEVVPRNMLRHGMHHAILVRHGIALFVSGNVANVQTRVRINVVRFA